MSDTVNRVTSLLAAVTLAGGCCGQPRVPKAAAPEAAAPVRADPASPPESAPSEPVVYVSVGYLHLCVLTGGGEVRCEGENALDQLRVPAGELTSVSAGLYHSCGLRRDQTVVCWGSDRGPYKGNATPNLPPPPAEKFRVVSAGDGYTCGLDLDNRLLCWGNAPWLDQAPQGEFVEISAGFDHCCARRASGEVACFGEDRAGTGAAEEYGPPEEETAPQESASILCTEMEDVPAGICKPNERFPLGWAPPPAGLVAEQIAAGAGHTCALTRAGSVRCWGADGWGDGHTIWAGQTRVPEGLTDVVEVTAGGGHSCARARTGKVTCWGDIGSPTGEFTQIDSGAFEACGLRRDGTYECWPK